MAWVARTSVFVCSFCGLLSMPDKDYDLWLWHAFEIIFFIFSLFSMMHWWIRSPPTRTEWLFSTPQQHLGCALRACKTPLIPIPSNPLMAVPIQGCVSVLVLSNRHCSSAFSLSLVSCSISHMVSNSIVSVPDHCFFVYCGKINFLFVGVVHKNSVGGPYSDVIACRLSSSVTLK